MKLASLSARESDDSILLTAANQLNLGGPNAFQDTSQSITVAALNLRAGKKAMEMSDYGAAYSYFHNGMSFLREGHWQEHYDLSLQLFELAAKCALANGDFASLKLCSEQVVTEARCFEDGLNVMYFATCALAYALRLPDSIQQSLGILKKLGIDLRQSRSAEECVQETKMLLSTLTDDEILNTKQMTDPTTIIALKFLAKLEIGMSQTKPSSVPFVTQQIIELSLGKGMSPMSPIGFVYFGSYLAKAGDISEGYNYVKLALSLLDRVGSRESAGEVICIATQVMAFVEPLQAALQRHNEGYAASLAAGDVFNAMLNRSLMTQGNYISGVKLQTLREEYAQTVRMLEANKNLILLAQIKHAQRDVLRLIGSDEHVTIPQEENLIASNNSVLKNWCFRKTYISFMFRSYDDAKEHVAKFFDCREKAHAQLLTMQYSQTFYVGLISFWVTRKSGLQYWFGRGNESKLALKKWAESSQWTFENKWYLLEAEESFSNNDYEAAKSFYTQAISSAKLHKVRSRSSL
jgi:predicted ATPase